MATTPNYSVNYDDKRFKEAEAQKNEALNEIDETFGNMISESDKYYQEQINASEAWANEQARIQQENTEFAIEQIEQQKEQTHKDYIKEQSGAYVDWQKQSNPYGANAEAVAAQGMTNTGYSESSQVSMYNTYQNRVAVAREAYTRAVLNYDNAITNARLQNNAVLAEIAYNAFQQQLELSIDGFQYKNSLVIEQSNKKLEVANTFNQQFQNVYNQIMQENAFAEEVRQFNENFALQEKEYEEGVRQFNEQMAEEQRQFNAQMEEEKRQFNTSNSSGGSTKSSSGGSSKKATVNKSSGGSTSGSGITKSGNATTVSQRDNSSGGLTVDTASVLALGFGPISASRLNELVKSGVVEEYQSGNKLKYRKTPSTNKQLGLYKTLG